MNFHFIIINILVYQLKFLFKLFFMQTLIKIGKNHKFKKKGKKFFSMGNEVDRTR